MQTMTTFTKPFCALVIGASGTIGQSLVKALDAHPNCTQVLQLSRHTQPAIDYHDLATIQTAFDNLKEQAPFQLIINTIGVLHTQQWMPEKRLKDLNEVQLKDQFLINAIGPALTIQQFSQLIDSQGGVFATLSAKVGSIEDNRLGGWYSYRSSKAALNMLIKTAAIELKRTKPNMALVAIHPGTVKSTLSQPFRGDEIGRDPDQAANEILSVVLSLTSADTGTFKTYNGENLPW
ncbi:MAG: SDR family NAD(P)-dependent oxidoreductase [Betaproteobacteria bacterium]|nr:SDR family NAD(P)-dependent oxidoreductase [Betaproteobacteria bacterium]